MLIKKGGIRKDTDKDIILRSYIAQGINELYLKRSHYHRPGNREYDRVNAALNLIMSEIGTISANGAKLLVSKNGEGKIIPMDQHILLSIEYYFKFLIILPPSRTIMISKWKKSIEIGMMRVPTLTYILYSLLYVKIPAFYRYMVDEYACISLAIIEIIGDQSSASKTYQISKTITNGLESKVEENKLVKYKEKIRNWIELGFLV